MTAPGLWLQKITTQPPSDDQTEIAIRALDGAMELGAEAGRRTRYRLTELTCNIAKSWTASRRRFEELTRQMADPEIISDTDKYWKIAKQQSELGEVVAKYREWKKVHADLEGARPMLQETDAELRQMAADDVERLEPELARLENELKILLLPKDPNDEKNVVLEIRKGTGGDEASLFAAELFRMYTGYAETRGWKVEVTSASESRVGGLNEVIALVSGHKVYSQLKYESGVHRVQRVPATETAGPRPYFRGDRRRAARSRRRRNPDRSEGHPHRHVLFVRSRRAVGEHNLLGRAHHAPADGPGGVLPGREVADQESGESRARAALAPV